MKRSNKLSITLFLTIVVVSLFLLEDPYRLLFYGLLLSTGRLFSKPRIDLTTILVIICIYQWTVYLISRKVDYEAVYNFTFCTLLFIQLRHLLLDLKNEILIYRFILIIIFVFISITSVSLVFFLKRAYLSGFDSIYPLRFLYHPLGYPINTLSSVYTIFLGIVGVGFYKDKGWRIGYFTAWILISILLLLTFSRASYIVWIGYAIWYIFAIQIRRNKLYLITISFGVFLCVLIFFPKETSTTLSMNKTNSQIVSTISRVNTSGKAITVFQQSPWFGAGMGNYSLAMDKVLNQDSTYSFTTYAPNIIVAILIEQGLFGLSLFLCLLLLVVYRVLKMRDNKIVFIASGCLVFFLLKEMSICTMFNNKTVMLLTSLLFAVVSREIEWEHNKQPIQHNKKKILILVSSATALSVFFIITDLRNDRNNKINKEAIEYFQNGNYKESVVLFEKLPNQLPFLINKSLLILNAPKDVVPEAFSTEILHSISKLQQEIVQDVFVNYLYVLLQKKIKIQKRHFRL